MTAPIPYYQATEPLFVYNPDAGTGPARAFNAGDWVPAELVDPNDWSGGVQVPAWFAGDLVAAAAPAPAAAGAAAADTPETASN